MHDSLALPFISAAKSHFHIQWFARLKEIMNHPLLQEEEKFLWLWLATQCANNASFSCSFSYEHISQAVCKSSRKIHRILFRLTLMGFLKSTNPIPMWYGEPTLVMVKEIRFLKLTLPPKLPYAHKNIAERSGRFSRKMYDKDASRA
jgi:hypothetical protein